MGLFGEATQGGEGEPGRPDGSVVTLVPTKSDKDRADEFRTRSLEAIKPLLDVMSEATRAGFNISFNISPNFMGQATVTSLGITKNY